MSPPGGRARSDPPTTPTACVAHSPTHPAACLPARSVCHTAKCFHNEDAPSHKCYEACDVTGAQFHIAGINITGRCSSQYNVFEKVGWEYQCPDGVTNTKYCATAATGGPPLNITIATKGEA